MRGRRWYGMIIIRRRSADSFKIFLLCLQFLIFMNRSTLLRGKCKGNAQIYAETLKGKVPKTLGRLFEQNLKGIGNSLGNAQQGLGTLSAMLTEQRRHFWKCPNKVETQWVHFPPGLQPIGNKETPLVSCPPCLHIFQPFSVYFFEAWRFYLT